jgi:hypothetical protein
LSSRALPWFSWFHQYQGHCVHSRLYTSAVVLVTNVHGLVAGGLFSFTSWNTPGAEVSKQSCVGHQNPLEKDRHGELLNEIPNPFLG